MFDDTTIPSTSSESCLVCMQEILRTGSLDCRIYICNRLTQRACAVPRCPRFGYVHARYNKYKY